MLTFGTKKLLKSDKSKFLEKRDNQIVYVGDKNEVTNSFNYFMTKNITNSLIKSE